MYKPPDGAQLWKPPNTTFDDQVSAIADQEQRQWGMQIPTLLAPTCW